MPEENLGSGLYLDQTLDFGVGSTGDLRHISGSSELEKDLSFQLLIILDDLMGQPLTPEVEAQVKSLTVDTILSDSRVDDIDRGSMNLFKPNAESLIIQTLVTAGGSEQELVLNL